MALRVRGATPEELELCFAVRRRVFVEGQGVPEQIELDGLDRECAHFIALDGERAIGTARLRLVEGVAKAERVAVLEESRGAGVGESLMAALEAAARERGLERVVLNAQEPVIPFYRKLGYTAEGATFMEADIPHRRMTKELGRG